MSLTGQEQYSISILSADITSENWLNSEDSERSINSYNHISFDDSYKRIVHELSTMDDRFYPMFDAKNPEGCPIGEKRREFAVLELIKMLDIIYWTPNYNSIPNDGLIDDDDDDDKQFRCTQKCIESIEERREQCATDIWMEWTREILRGPRFGLILISNIKTTEAKVLLVAHINNDQYNYSYPKGKPYDRETIINGGCREAIEEIHMDIMDFSIYTPENGGVVIKKDAYIDSGKIRRSRKYYYLITQTSLEYEAFKPQKNEILDVVWYPVNRIPCCDGCRIRPKVMDIKNDEGIPINYHMVTLRDINNESPAILDILNYINKENDNKDVFINYFHFHRRCGHNLE